MKRLVRRVGQIYNKAKQRIGALWAWAKKGTRPKRLRAIIEWAKRHQLLSHSIARRQRFWKIRREARKLLHRFQRRHHPHPDPNPGGDWPASMHITELYNNDNGYHNHVHIASTDRDGLIHLGNIAVDQYGGAGAVREFPPFDPVECVHVSTSWHYRDSSSPYTPRTCPNRGDGCAMDLGFIRRQEFANEVKQRYGADSCDF